MPAAFVSDNTSTIIKSCWFLVAIGVKKMVALLPNQLSNISRKRFDAQLVAEGLRNKDFLRRGYQERAIDYRITPSNPLRSLPHSTHLNVQG